MSQRNFLIIQPSNPLLLGANDIMSLVSQVSTLVLLLAYYVTREPLLVISLLDRMFPPYLIPTNIGIPQLRTWSTRFLRKLHIASILPVLSRSPSSTSAPRPISCAPSYAVMLPSLSYLGITTSTASETNTMASF